MEKKRKKKKEETYGATRMRSHSLIKLRGWYQKLHGTVLTCLRLSSSLCVTYDLSLSQMLKCLSCQPLRPAYLQPWHLMRAINIPLGRHFARSSPRFESYRVSSYTLEHTYSLKSFLRGATCIFSQAKFTDYLSSHCWSCMSFAPSLLTSSYIPEDKAPVWNNLLNKDNVNWYSQRICISSTTS